MSKQSITEAIKKVRGGELHPFYYLIGKETFFHDQFIDAIIESTFSDKASRDLNLTILYGSENTLSELLSAALSYPMLAQHKLVIVREFEKMKLSESDALEKYLDHPQKSTCLVLSAEDRGRSGIFQKIPKVAETIECKPIPEYRVGEWITAQAKLKGYEIEPPAVQFLVSQVGAHLLNLDQELEKLQNFISGRSTITVEDLEQTTGVSRETSVFALQKELSRKHLLPSLRISKMLLDTGNDITMINAVLFAFFRKMLIAASLRQRGKSRQQIGKEMRLNDFQMRDIHEALSHFNLDQLKTVIGLLHKTDMDAKTSAQSAGPALQMLCYKICRI